MQVVERRAGAGLSGSSAFVRRLTADLALNPIEHADAIYGLFGDWRLCRLVQIEELVPTTECELF
jgi:hypothetical protein